MKQEQENPVSARAAKRTKVVIDSPKFNDVKEFAKTPEGDKECEEYLEAMKAKNLNENKIAVSQNAKATEDYAKAQTRYNNARGRNVLASKLPPVPVKPVMLPYNKMTVQVITINA